MLTRLFTLALALLLLPAAALADLDIKKARYGRDSKYRDVRDIVAAHVQNNDWSFRVTDQAMGGDVNRGEDDYLYIVYEVAGREYTDTITNGRIFTFRGVDGVRPDRGFGGLLPPAAPTTSPLSIYNDSGRVVLIYVLDRYGRWLWQTELGLGQAHTARAVVGQRWKITNRANETLRDLTIRSGENRIRAAGGSAPAFGGPGYGGQVRVRFENQFPGPVYVYQVNRAGGWTWSSALEPDATYGVNAAIGDTWVVTDRRGRILRNLRVGPETTSVRIAF